MPQLSFDWVTPTGIPLTISFACQASIYVSELFRSIRARAKVEGMRAGLVHQLLLGQDAVSGIRQAGIPSYNCRCCCCFCIWRLSISRNVASTDRIQKVAPAAAATDDDDDGNGSGRGCGMQKPSSGVLFLCWLARWMLV